MLEKLIPAQYRGIAIALLIIIAVLGIYGKGHRDGHTSTRNEYEARIAKMVADNATAVAEAKEAIRKADAEQIKMVRDQLAWAESKAHANSMSFHTIRETIRLAPGADTPAAPVILQTIRRGQ